MALFSNTVTHRCTRDRYRMKKKKRRKKKSENTEPWQDLQLWMHKEGGGGEEARLGTTSDISALLAKPSHFFSSDLRVYCLYSATFSKLVFVCWYLPVKANPLTSGQTSHISGAFSLSDMRLAHSKDAAPLFFYYYLYVVLL